MAQTPAVQRIARRLEQGGVLSCAGLCQGAQPFFAALLRHLFPRRPLVVVTEGLKSQESFHQDVSTWLHAASRTLPETSTVAGGVLFYPAWEVLPHEGKLPHADVISERLETLVALSRVSAEPVPGDLPQPMVIANVIALLQRTFPAQALRERMRLVRRGDPLDPLDLIEWLEDQGYEPEAQVNHKGEIALRGGILDLFPLNSPWPVRLEFFGNELESLRYFDPITQISREPVECATLAPAGEIGILRKLVEPRDPGRRPPCLATLPDHLPRETLWLLCEPEALEQQAASCAELVPTNDPFFVSWETFLTTLDERGMTRLEVAEGAADVFECADLAGTLNEPSSLASPVQSWGRVPVPESPSPSPLPSLMGRGNSSGTPVQVGRRVSLSPHSSPSQNRPEDNPAASSRHPIGERSSLSPRERVEVRGNQTCTGHEGTDHLNASQEQDLAEPAVGATSRAAPDDELIGQESGDKSRPSQAGAAILPSPPSILNFNSLDAFRPIIERAPEPPVAEAQRREFFAQLHRWRRQGYDVHVFCNNNGERQRFSEIWDEYGFTVHSPKSKIQGPTSDAENGPWALGLGLWTHLGSLARGFLCEEARLVVVTDAEIFGRYKVQRPRRLKSPHAQTSRSLLEIDFGELEEGDYVVHLQHGIGRYLGLQVLPPTRQHRASAADPSSLPPGTGQECLVIEYAQREPAQPPPRLYVPVREAHLVSKYIGAGKARPPLNTLGGTRWAKTKEQAERAVRDLAAELLSIQAARESLPGHAFTSDTPWQREFESAFLYEETPDQRRAIVETKADLERQKPMDRLICGDVGYGKTEVAIRAAFKAVMGGKQVAMLVPTTILAQQHFNTFRERMADYPIRIELLSRFRTRRQQQRVIRELASGAVDIVIGTHRLVQEDIAFKDVGLVVIDEEQRFGVLHKEKFKRLRQLVDVLTLSATPIPRTLYLALTGARDMSTIETPPQDRLPVETIVTQYDERVIRDAIQRELNRGGQVFYLHNRVFDIAAVAARLMALVPKARLVVGHGQMPDDDLEEVMTQFVNGDADVLLSTTIIESGIDIPNANTIIIDRADRFGLSDLYQLRGRVGRYKHQAYAYLLIPRHAGLLSDARKRISAIRQYSALGSGFRIAMRDLEIRGAGNLLGPQQSGHITAVGFELYCQLLKQSIGALKGEKVKPRLAVHVRLDFLALNPGEEAEVRGQRSEVSKRKPATEPDVAVPRETPVYVSSGDEVDSAFRTPHSALKKSAAYIPVNYIADARQRVEIYRKLAEVVDEPSLERLKGELRDRFGPLPAAVNLLLQVTWLKIAADERGITAIETDDDKLKLTRNHDFIMIDGKFPRLTRTTAKARLGEIVRICGAL